MPADIQLPAYDTQDRAKSQWMKNAPAVFTAGAFDHL
jgi:hypothetical protein